MLELGGLGHSAVIHSTDDPICASNYGEEMKVGRVIANSPSSQGAIGDIYNTNTPSLTLGCGSYRTKLHHLQRVLRQPDQQKAHRTRGGSICSGSKFRRRSTLKKIRFSIWRKCRIFPARFIVTDPTMVKLGYVDKVLYYLSKREQLLPLRDLIPR